MTGHKRDPKRVRFWREALGRRARSRLSVHEFCDQEGLLATTYQHWRRELARRDARRPTALSKRRHRSLAPAFVPVQFPPTAGRIPESWPEDGTNWQDWRLTEGARADFELGGESTLCHKGRFPTGIIKSPFVEPTIFGICAVANLRHRMMHRFAARNN
jgi:hypothetical protein